MFPPHSNQGHGFKQSSRDDGTIPSMPIQFPMPQPFRHGTVVYGQSNAYPGYPPAFQPTYGPWQPNDEASLLADADAQHQAHRYSPQNSSGHPPESFSPQEQGPTSRPAPFCTSPLSLQSELEPLVEVRELNAEDIKPNVYHFAHLSNALQELETCKTIFKQCDDKLVNDLYVRTFPVRLCRLMFLILL